MLCIKIQINFHGRKISWAPTAAEGGVNEQQSLGWRLDLERCFSPIRPTFSSTWSPQLRPERAEGAAPSAFSHLGGERRVLLTDGLVVVQDPLQVGHGFVAVLRLDLQGDTERSVLVISHHSQTHVGF